MRIDHFAYQRGTQVAGFGFFIQLIIAIGLLIFARLSGPQADTACLYGGLYALVGLVVWISLIVVFHQHKLERLEALEEDELAQARETGGGGRSMFDSAEDESRVAARRLRKMHQWMMPGVSLLLAAVLGLLAWRMLGRLFLTNEATGETVLNTAAFRQTPAIGWAVAICLAFAAVSFIFSRFVAGMAKHSAWQNLRGGAGYLVGNALVLLAVAVGVVFRFFDEDPTKLSPVLQNIVIAIPILMIVQSLEILLNFVLNLYRPRIPGEVPRPAFDSRVLSMLAAPDSLVRSINEAVNYQFGFDVTSTWGYQLLTRSVIKLVVIAVVALLLLSALEVVEPQQQAVKLAGGRIVGDRVHESGLMVKLPWPLQSSQVHDVWTVRELALTPRRTEFPPVNAWVKRGGEQTLDVEDEPFLVGASRFDDVATFLGAAGPALGRAEETAADAVSESFALLNAEIILQYRIRAGNDGLLEYLRFAPDTIGRRDSLTTRQKVLRSIARREVGLHLSALTLDEVLARKRAGLADELRTLIQDAFDANRTGVDVVAVNVPLLQPAGQAVRNFEDLAIATQNLEEYKAKAVSSRVTSLTYLIGDPENADAVVDGIKAFNDLAREHGNDHPDVVARRDAVEQMMLNSGGNAGQLISRAYADRWGELLSTRADAVRVAGQVEAFRAAPALYREREIMRVLKRQIRDQRRYVLGIDSSRVHIDFEFKDLSSVLDFATSLADQPQETQGP